MRSTSFLFLTTLVALLCVAAVPSSVVAKDKPILAVMGFEDKTGKFSERQIESAGEYLRMKLEISKAFRVVDSSRQAQALVKQMKKESYKACYDDRCQIDLGVALAADTILSPSLSYFGGTCTLAGILTDLASETSAGGAEADFDCTEKGLKTAVELLALKLSGGQGSSDKPPELPIGELPGNWKPPGTVKVIVQFDSDPPGAVVMMDGDLLCQETPCSENVAVGGHRFSMAKKDFVKMDKPIVVEEGTSLAWKLVPDFGFVTVLSTPAGLDVKIDGEVVGKTPLERYRVQPGTHQVLVTSPAHFDSGKSVTLARGEKKKLEITLKDRTGVLDITAKDHNGNAIPAEIYLNGRWSGRAPYRVTAPIGDVGIEARHAGLAATEVVEVRERKQTRVEIKFPPPTQKSATRPAGITSAHGNAYLIHLGFDATAHTTYGLFEFAFYRNRTARVRAPFQISLFENNADDFVGLAQLGIVNRAGQFRGLLQLGWTNETWDDSFALVQWGVTSLTRSKHLGLLQVAAVNTVAGTQTTLLQAGAVNLGRPGSATRGGFQLGAYNRTHDVHLGVQAGLYNRVDRSFKGLFQVGLANRIGEEFFGLFQIGALNWADSGGGITGVELAAVNIKKGRGDATVLLEVGVVANWVEDFNGVQLASILNRADEFAGLQVSAGFNGAEEMSGVQVGLVNYADEVYGVQIGALNSCKKLRGVQLGLINRSRRGGLPFMLGANIGVGSSGSGRRYTSSASQKTRHGFAWHIIGFAFSPDYQGMLTGGKYKALLSGMLTLGAGATLAGYRPWDEQGEGGGSGIEIGPILGFEGKKIAGEIHPVIGVPFGGGTAGAPMGVGAELIWFPTRKAPKDFHFGLVLRAGWNEIVGPYAGLAATVQGYGK